jgi:type II secretory ATPase GspE/PulE/Tfp pilus assembly ATPase PilB-like protein
MALTSTILSSPIRLRDKLLHGYITPEQLQAALIQQRHKPQFLGEILVQLGFIDPLVLQQLLAEHTGYPAINLEMLTLVKEVLICLPRALALQHRMLIFAQEEDLLHVSMADPEDIFAKDALRNHFTAATQFCYYHAVPQHILQSIARAYPPEEGTSFSQDAEIIRLVEDFLLKALRANASDIHFQPEESIISIKLRVCGLLQPGQPLHKNLWPALCVRLKILAQLDIAESRRPQSGHFSLSLYGRAVNFRVSTHPTLHGENIVVRILDPAKILLNLEELGFDITQRTLLTKLAGAPQGLIVFSGPTGSGKTTSLYTLLASMDHQTRHIATLEQPIEYRLSGIRQTEIRDKEVLSFANGIRSLLRQDPDVLMIGEVRDEETAQMAVRAAMTGHLVLTTVHANDCVATITRLLDLGVPLTSLANHLLCTLSQRLVRKICNSCRGQGCETCQHSGYHGRTVVATMLPITPDLARMMAKGMAIHSPENLWQAGLRQVAQGVTTHAEILRVIGEPL